MALPAPPPLGEQIERQLTRRNTGGLRRLLSRSNFADLAEAFSNGLSLDDAVQCVRLMSPRHAAPVLIQLDRDLQRAILADVPEALAAQILRVMPDDDAVDLLQELDDETQRALLGSLPFDADTRTLHQLLLAEPDTAAGLMSTDFIQASVDSTVGEVLDLIRGADEKDFIYYGYLVDAEESLVGVVSLKKLILHPEDTPVSRIATFDVKSILMGFDQELVANLFRKYNNLLAMPVVDSQSRLAGIVTLDDILYVIDEETSEDIYRTSGITLEAIDEKNLLTGPMINAVKARLPWLSVTLLGQFLASNIIASFSHTVSAAAIAVSFMPLLSGLSGNMGAQSETIAVRGLALNLLNDQNIMDKFRREMRVALTTGGVFSVAVGGLSLIQYRRWELSAVLLCSVLLSVCLSAALGILMPYAYQRYFKQDPAGVGGPFITTLLDILNFSTYLYIVTLLLDRMI